MRRGMIGGIALALLVGLAVPVLGDDKDGKDSGSASWLPTWLGGKKPADHKEPALDVIEKSARPAADQIALQRKKEEAAYFRRQEAADRLEELALAAGDEEQVRHIHQLKERIWAIYLQRTANLAGQPSNCQPGTDGPKTAQADEGLLEHNLGTTTRRPALLTGEESLAPGAPSTANLGGAK